MTASSGGRERLHRDRVLAAAVELADREGLDALSMRRLATGLGVVPMALYKHVADKDGLLAAMVEQVLAGIPDQVRDDRTRTREDGTGNRDDRAEARSDTESRDAGEDRREDGSGPDGWRGAIRARVLAARRVQLQHPWLRRVLESGRARTPAVLAHLDAVIGAFRSGGFSDPLTHHVMHALGSRVWGFTQDLFEADQTPPDPATAAQLAVRFPNLVAVAATASHDRDSVVAPGCDDQFEFEFALDLLLDGFARLHDERWLPPQR